jgi:UDP-2,3-diacylglucosamine hydrolase
MKASDITDVNHEEVARVMAQYKVRTLIHGHTHRPAVHDLGNEKQRIVLGDWDTQGWYIEASASQLKLQPLPFSSTTTDC